MEVVNYIVNNKSANTSGEAETTVFQADGGQKNIFATATNWGTAVVTLRASRDGVTWVDIRDNGTPVTITYNDLRLLDKLNTGLILGAKITGCTGGESGITVSVH